MYEISLLPNGMAQLTNAENGESVRYSLFEGRTILGHWDGQDRPEYREAVAKTFGGLVRMPETFDGRLSNGHADLIR